MRTSLEEVVDGTVSPINLWQTGEAAKARLAREISKIIPLPQNPCAVAAQRDTGSGCIV